MSMRQFLTAGLLVLGACTSGGEAAEPTVPDATVVVTTTLPTRLDRPQGATDTVIVLEQRHRPFYGPVGRIEFALYGDRTFVAEERGDDDVELVTGEFDELQVQDLLRRALAAGLFEVPTSPTTAPVQSCTDSAPTYLTLTMPGAAIERRADLCADPDALAGFESTLRDAVDDVSVTEWTPARWITTSETDATCVFSDERVDRWVSRPVFPHEEFLPIEQIIPGCEPLT
ncbi:hypothetical protein YM304_08830 [Ilumatobacter coccineus YM16-304]|uniref:Uncharacterized protein n=2 Tax=Ilumatobacter coccineus TaxID=467094 RepID=A0A6C7E276_ILUCY|nr:hypothetical protein YM304_08830 [Ilumatobacter coccineus YM16-304]